MPCKQHMPHFLFWFALCGINCYSTNVFVWLYLKETISNNNLCIILNLIKPLRKRSFIGILGLLHVFQYQISKEQTNQLKLPYCGKEKIQISGTILLRNEYFLYVLFNKKVLFKLYVMIRYTFIYDIMSYII
jgi:hypothetical protein